MINNNSSETKHFEVEESSPSTLHLKADINLFKSYLTRKRRVPILLAKPELLNPLKSK